MRTRKIVYKDSFITDQDLMDKILAQSTRYLKIIL